jgi:dihydrofolate reductase
MIGGPSASAARFSLSKLIEINHLSLGGEVGKNDWALPYLDDDHTRYATQTLSDAEALLLGRVTYEGLSAAYTAMPSSPFVDRMNQISKYVASKTLHEFGWNAQGIEGDVATFVAGLKARSTGNILKYGNGVLDATVMAAGLIDEFHLLLTPVATSASAHMFEFVSGAPRLNLLRVETFKSGVVLLIYGAAMPGGSNNEER